MQSFNSELKVGVQAVIINVHHPENTHLIGKMVMVEALLSIGESIQEWYDNTYTVLPLKSNMAVVTGIGTGKYHKDGYVTIQQKYLMPLPPLDDDAIIFANENVKEATKMLIDFENPTIASNDEIKAFKAEDLKAIGSKYKGGWVFTAYVETSEKIILCALSHGKNPKKVMREVMTNAINRIKETSKC